MARRVKGDGMLAMLRTRALRHPLVFAALGAVGCETSTDSSVPRPATPAIADDGGARDAGGAPARPFATLWGAAVLVDENPDPDVVEVKLRAQRGRANFAGKDIEVLAFNGTVPGPILQVRPHQRVIVHFDNALDEPTTIHWHGLRIPAAMDGSPRIQEPVPPGGSFTYDFIVPEAGSYWYHPHVNTHDQLERGLYGAIVVQGEQDPEYDLERSLALDDVLLDSTTGEIRPPALSGSTPLAGRYGNTLLTNGRAVSLATAAVRKGTVERWRLVNTANAREMTIRLEGARARLIGADGGLLGAPIDWPSSKILRLPVGGRRDLEVSYDAAGTARLVLVSEDSATDLFTVGVEDSAASPRSIPWPTVVPVIGERAASVTFDMMFDYSAGQWTVNGVADPMTPILTVKQGDVVKMRLANVRGSVAHPFHMHGQFFRASGEEAAFGLLDTVTIPTTGPVEILAYFDNPGRWMAHCHILEHAAVGMMAEIEVTETGAPSPGSGMAH